LTYVNLYVSIINNQQNGVKNMILGMTILGALVLANTAIGLVTLL